MLNSSGAVAEAWAWLEANALVADTPGSGGGWSFVTRAGRTLASRPDGLPRLRAEQRLGLELHPRIAGKVQSQFLLGEKTPPAALQPGDVVFFGSPIHHVGMYVGGGYFIHAPRTGDFVKLSRLADRKDYAGARRYAWVPRTGPIQGVTTSPLDALND